MTTADRQPPEVGGPQRVDAVADVGQLRQQHVERADERGDHQERARPHPDEPFERGRRLAGRRRRCRRAARAAAPSTPACASPPTAPAVGGTGMRVGECVRSEHPGRRRDEPARRRRARRATPAARRGRWPASAPSPTRSPNPRSMMTGPSAVDEDVRGAQGPVREARRVQRCDLAPHRVEQRRRRSRSGVELVEAAPSTYSTARAIEPSASAVSSLDPRAASRRPAHAPSAAGSASCSTSCSSDIDGQSSFGSAQQERAVAAVEEIGVAAVVRVHLDERRVDRRQRRAT